MQPMRFGPWDVFAYESLLHTRSPLLRWMYCESHAWEQWAITGLEQRLGEYRFPNVLYVAHDEREAWLDRVFDDVLDVAGWAASVEERFRREGRRLVRALRSGHVPTLLEAAPRYLSVGVFKEALTDEAVLVLLGQFLPAQRVKALVPALWQPRCLPHFLKFESRALFAAERGDVELAVQRAAHHSRFLLEDTPFHDRAAMSTHLRSLGRGARQLRARRLALLHQHRRAVARAEGAERKLLAELRRFGRHTPASMARIQTLLGFIRFLATDEELKHVLLVEAARALRRAMDARGLLVEATGPEQLR